MPAIQPSSVRLAVLLAASLLALTPVSAQNRVIVPQGASQMEGLLLNGDGSISVNLAPTLFGPAGAAGWAGTFHPDGNPQNAYLSVDEGALDPGPYSVSVTNSATGLDVVFGSLTVPPPALPPPPPPPGSSVPASVVFPGSPIFVIGDFPFPDGFTPAQVQNISVIDSHGVTVLTTKPGKNGNIFREALYQSPLPLRFTFLPDIIPGYGWAAVVQRGNALTLDLTTSGLNAGLYSIIVTNSADGSATNFGPLFVTLVPDPPDVFNQISAGSFQIPANFNPKNIAAVFVVDFTGATKLATDPTATLGNPIVAHYPTFVLKPTASAPVGASGSATIETVYGGVPPDPSSVAACLAINTVGLFGDSFTASVTSRSTGATTVLGKFGLSQAFYPEIPNGGAAVIPFPSGFDTADVASLQISDASNKIILTGDETASDGSVSGGALSSRLRERIPLQTVSQTAAGLRGRALLTVDSHGANTVTGLTVTAFDLAPGTYRVTVTNADGSFTVLGPLQVAAAAGQSGPTIASAKFGAGGAALPAGFDATKIAAIQVGYPNGFVVLAGNVTAPTSATTNFSVKVQVTPGAAGPNVAGRAALSGSEIAGVLQQTLTISAHGAPKSAPLTILVNGKSIGTVRTTPFGRISLAISPKGLGYNITSALLQTADGQTVLSAGF